jgi:glycosyltransferase involved in cell wall biosynthesis
MDSRRLTIFERTCHFLNGKLDILLRAPGRLFRRTRRELMLKTLNWTPGRRDLVDSISIGLRNFLDRCGGEKLFHSSDIWRQMVLEAIRAFDIQNRKGPKVFLTQILSERQIPPGRPKSFVENQNPKRLKILFVTGMFPSIEHGGGLRIFDILMNLSERHEIDLYSVFDPKMDCASLQNLRSRLRKIRTVDLVTFSGADAQEWLSNRRLEEGYYDVIHYEYDHSIDLIEDLRSWTRRSVFTMIECLGKSFFLKLSDCHEKNGSAAEAGSLLARLFIHALHEKKGFHLSDAAVSVTTEDAEYGLSSAIVPTGISDFAVYRPALLVKDLKPTPLTAMFLGFYDHSPNVEAMQWYLRTIHPLVKAKLPDYRFSVVGAGNTEVLRDEFGDDPNVEITGRVEDFVPYIARSKVCISPLISGAGIRGKINQYSAVGRPTVSTSIGVAGVNYKDQESVIIADNPGAFAQGIIRLLTNEQFWSLLAKNASVLAKKEYSWSGLINKLEKVYFS